MKALTLIQPWAELIADGRKTIETRSWDTKYRGQIAIHAGLKIDREFNFSYGVYLTEYKFPTGAVIAVATLVSTFKMTEEIIDNTLQEEKDWGDWRPGRFGWALMDVQRIEPVPARGSLGLWNWTPPSILIPQGKK